MCIVDDVSTALQRLSVHCDLFANFMDNPPRDTVSLSNIGLEMSLLRDCLDEQIKALEEINWNAKKEMRHGQAD